MKATPESIWRVPAYLPYVQPPLTDAMIVEAEAAIGHRLPAAYLDLLRVQNGGYIRFTLPESVHFLIHGIGPNFPSLTGFDWEDYQEHVPFPLDGLVPFDGDGHWYLCLDYRAGKKEPVVTLIDIECDDEEPVAESFAAYLDLLRIEVGDNDFLLLGVTDVEALTRELGGKLGVEFEPPSCWAHGYPVHRAGFDIGEAYPAWIWLSPNRVPRGFIREEDPRYEELKDSMPGEALRYPELPGGAYLLGMTEPVAGRVLAACRELGLDVRPLVEYVG